MAWARAQLEGHSGIVFAQRIETRPGSANSGRTTTDPAQFAHMKQQGGLAWDWQAHGFAYGIANRYALQAAWGRVVVVNGSREHVARLQAEPAVRTVQITAPADALVARLAHRARETPDAITARMERNQRFESRAADLVLANDGALSDAGSQLTQFLLAQARI